MKKTYIAPEGTVIVLMAEENLAVLDGHRNGGIAPINKDDTPGGETSYIPGERPF